MSSSLLAINYHYIGNKDRYPFPGIVGVSREEFAAQLDILARDFKFVSKQELANAIYNKRPLPERALIITLDDGLQEQFVEALPIMVAKGIPFIFFVPSLPYAEQKACTVHKIHYLRSILSPNDFIGKVTEAACRLFPLTDPLMGIKEQVPINFYPYDDDDARTIKYYLNFYLPSTDTARLINDIFTAVTDEAEFCRWFYLTEAQLQEVHQKHDALGLHCHSHLKLTDLSDAEAEHEMAFCKLTIENIVGSSVQCLSYPYGYRQAVSLREERIAKKLGLSFCFTMESCLNRDVTLAPHLLGRINNNEAPGHPAAAFCVEKGEVVIHNSGRMSNHRGDYYQEKLALCSPVKGYSLL